MHHPHKNFSLKTKWKWMMGWICRWMDTNGMDGWVLHHFLPWHSVQRAKVNKRQSLNRRIAWKKAREKDLLWTLWRELLLLSFIVYSNIIIQLIKKIMKDGGGSHSKDCQSREADVWWVGRKLPPSAPIQLNFFTWTDDYDMMIMSISCMACKILQS